MATVRKNKTQKGRTKPYLEQTGGVGRGRLFELSREILSIGRSEDNEIVLKSESVSRCHAYLKLSDVGWLLQDNNSKNGVLVNGKRQKEFILRDGDLLVLGDFAFRFYVGSIALESPAPVYQVRQPVSEPNGFSWVGYFEKHSWLAGLIAGALIGGGLWWRSTHHSSQRPGSAPVVAVAPTPAPQPVIQREPAPIVEKEAPATFASEATEAPQVTKRDLEVAPQSSRKTKSEIRDLKVYLKEGRDYLKEGDKESAAIAFRFALVLDPKNREARQGLRAAGVKLDRPKPTPTPAKETHSSSESRNRAKVTELLKGAVEAFNRRSYQEAIDKAEQARKIEIPGQTEYLNEAKQIIDRARLKQKEDFEPFLESALKKIEQGDFKGSAALCEEMLRTDPAYVPARECLAKSLNGIAGRKAP